MSLGPQNTYEYACVRPQMMTLWSDPFFFSDLAFLGRKNDLVFFLGGNPNGSLWLEAGYKIPPRTRREALGKTRWKHGLFNRDPQNGLLQSSILLGSTGIIPYKLWTTRVFGHCSNKNREDLEDQLHSYTMKGRKLLQQLHPWKWTAGTYKTPNETEKSSEPSAFILGVQNVNFQGCKSS